MYERLKVPLAFTWEIYGDSGAHFDDCFRMFNPVTRESFDQARAACAPDQASCALPACSGRVRPTLPGWRGDLACFLRPLCTARIFGSVSVTHPGCGDY